MADLRRVLEAGLHSLQLVGSASVLPLIRDMIADLCELRSRCKEVRRG